MPASEGEKRFRTNHLKYLGWLSLTLIFALFLLAACETTIISGYVINETGVPVPGATVRIKATTINTQTDSSGHFILANVPKGDPVVVTAWSSGYYIGSAQDIKPGKREVEITLIAYSEVDNPEYAFLPAIYHQDVKEDQSCSRCHSSVESDLNILLPIDEWLLDAHSRSATNPRFLSMYNGTDLSGNQSPPVRYRFVRDYGRFPIVHDPNQPYYGPGYKLDFPDTAGNCSTCHVPVAAVNDAYGIDPNLVTGVALEGVTCDFCHKINEVTLVKETGLPYINRTGILSLQLLRPIEEHQFFAGPLDDVAPGEDTYSSLQGESQLCAACHYGVFWDTEIYNSYGEWLSSTYSNPDDGKTCQDCHMPNSGSKIFALPEKGGTERNPKTIFSHQMPGAADSQLLQNSVTMTVKAIEVDNTIRVSVTLLNDSAGHNVPTDSPLRHMLLLVLAKDEQGEPLELLEGTTIPDWGGIGDPENGYYAGLPGKGYAKILEEVWTGVSPTGSYWNPTRLVSDNRIQAKGSDISNYAFKSLGKEKVFVTVQLIYRRAFIELMDQKGWDVADIKMEHEEITLSLEN